MQVVNKGANSDNDDGDNDMYIPLPPPNRETLKAADNMPKVTKVNNN